MKLSSVSGDRVQEFYVNRDALFVRVIEGLVGLELEEASSRCKEACARRSGEGIPSEQGWRPRFDKAEHTGAVATRFRMA